MQSQMPQWRLRPVSIRSAEIMPVRQRGNSTYIHTQPDLIEWTFIPISSNQTTQAPCTVEIEPCGNTCQKTLKCGNHICAERCHRGECGQCLEIVEKKCRCGLYTKELPCSKQYLCEAKCKQMRDCNKHPCNRKVSWASSWAELTHSHCIQCSQL